MEYRILPGTDLRVSEICLGTMTWGEQNSEADAHAQLDYAIAQGINCIDTAEMYPVPPNAKTQGRTEAYLGNWLARRGRDGLVIATKVAGPGRREWIRNGRTDLSREVIAEAVDTSLARLRVECIDLYQIHWPDPEVPFEESMNALLKARDQGKIRYIGVSNFSPDQLREIMKTGQVVSLQPPFNMFEREAEKELLSFCIENEIATMAYGGLCRGLLTCKFKGN